MYIMPNNYINSSTVYYVTNGGAFAKHKVLNVNYPNVTLQAANGGKFTTQVNRVVDVPDKYTPRKDIQFTTEYGLAALENNLSAVASLTFTVVNKFLRKQIKERYPQDAGFAIMN